MFDLSSPEFWLIFALITLVLSLKARRNRKPLILGKQISLSGEQLFTTLSPQTSLKCLLADGCIFGEDYQRKELPQLPHSETCTCRIEKVVKTGGEWFQEKPPQDWKMEFDKENPAPAHRRFLKYYLIVNHKDVDEDTRKNYQELLEHSQLRDDVQKKIIESLKTTL
jgi:hypothetical protein